MSDNQINKPNAEDAPNSRRSAANAAKASGWKRLLAKKWVSPAAFMAVAAIIVTVLWLYQGEDGKAPAGGLPAKQSGEAKGGTVGSEGGGTLEVTAGSEMVQWPVASRSEVEISVPYYEENGTSEEKQNALVQAGTTFMPHTGIDLAKADNSAFDVVAVLSGKVTYAGPHPTNGFEVEITHPNGMVSMYESLSNVTVKTGDEVKQGTVIAKAGRSELEKDMGVHLHFEVRENGAPVNPADVLPNN